ncbi:hypothetical protein DRW41_16120 [Neobacillus piezotolerans]|uniref:Uncharacterized protein n=1 Tax=Neobacillus piezotolerans TaxID=2259171 RepID=A0A3D8GN10_9BACI|nr:hypothetical protein [Neobacillus piezotolerans]RDU35671.1 hypothetical protein DRW41_16120 [Neobacillus piezotolerans]
MKLVMFFGLIALSLVASIIVCLHDFKNNNKPMMTIFKGIIINLIILGLGSIWWFLTETDGISQGIGIMIYAGSIAGITIIDVIFILVYQRISNQHFLKK